MPKPREPLPSPLDAVRKVLETGTIGGGRTREPEPETPGEGEQIKSSPPALQPSENSDVQNARIPEFQTANNNTSEQAISSFSQNSRIPERQPSRTLERENARTPAFKRSKPPAVPKTNADGWEQQTTYLPPDLRQWLRHYALDTDMEMSEIIAIALQEYRMRQQRG